MKVPVSDGTVRVVDKFLWWPKRLGMPGKDTTRMRWLSRAKMVQLKMRERGGGSRWVYRHFVEDSLSTDGPVHEAFGLSYASWFCMPRVLMQEMSVEWQLKFVALAEEFNATFDWLPDDAVMYVQLKTTDGKFMKVPRELCHYRHPDFEVIDRMRRNNSG